MKKQLLNVPTVKRRLFEFLKIITITVVLFVLVDIFLGAWIMSLVRPNEPFRIRHPIYHHSLKPNYDGIGRWGTWSYRICTDSNGFKTRCDQTQQKSKIFDVAFLGDSFTEGIGLPFEQTFVGMIAAQMPELRIANLGVVSYSPSIYLAKLNALYAQGFQFKHLIVMIDIGDAYDEANAYDLHDDAVVVDKGEPYPLSFSHQIRRTASQHMPLASEAWLQIKKIGSSINTVVTSNMPARQASPVTIVNKVPVNQASSEVTPSNQNTAGTQTFNRNTQQPTASALPDSLSATDKNESPFIKNIYEGIYLQNYPKSEWTYNNQSPYYGAQGVTGTIDKMKAEMQSLYALAKAHGTKISVGVYPWPGQIKYDVADSLHVKIWREFCQSRCVHFYNAFPSFFALAEQQGLEAFIYNYYFQGDVHFNERGNEILARVLLDTGLR